MTRCGDERAPEPFSPSWEKCTRSAKAVPRRCEAPWKRKRLLRPPRAQRGRLAHGTDSVGRRRRRPAPREAKGPSETRVHGGGRDRLRSGSTTTSTRFGSVKRSVV